ncbi:MAG: ThuA domain-containing protein [Bacteroidia bacterium]|nr:ThuA domain-containing protein [Bacteroidia bacterium]
MKQIFLCLVCLLVIAQSWAQDSLQKAPIKCMIYAEGDTSEIPFEIYNFLAPDPSLALSISYESNFLDSLAELDTYDALLLASRGKLSWSEEKRRNFEQFVREGGGVVGIPHAAEAFDDFPFYENLLGAKLLASADSFALLDLEKEGYHLITEAFPAPWKTGEYLPPYEITSSNIKPLFSYQNKPIAWYQNHLHRLDSSRSFFSVLGEDPLSFRSNPLFQKMIKRAIYFTAFRLPNPSPYPPGVTILSPKSGKTYKRYPKQVSVRSRFFETALSGEVDSLAILLNDSLYTSLPGLENFSILVSKPGLYELIIRAYTDKGNYISAYTNFAIRDEAGLGLALSIDHQPVYKIGDTLSIHTLIIHPEDTALSETPRDFGGELALFLNEELLVKSSASPFSYSYVLDQAGELLLKAQANAGELLGVDSLFLLVEAKEKEAHNPLKIFPNPLSKELAFSFESTSHGQGKWEILSLSGELIKRGSFLKEENPFSLEIDLSDMEAGLYLLRVRIGMEDFSSKFLRK